MTETAPASEVNPDVLNLTQRIVDKVNELVAGVESLDANNWLSLADEIDSLNNQLQAMIVAKPTTSQSVN